MIPAAPSFALSQAAGFALVLMLVALLWAHEGPRRANGWLVGAAGALALLILGQLWAPHLGRFTGWLAFVFGPCLWLFTCRVTGQTGPRGQRLAVHFIPAAALLLVLLPRQEALTLQMARPRTAPDALYVITALQMLAYWLLASLRLGRAGFLRLRLRLWICMAAWVAWIAVSY